MPGGLRIEPVEQRGDRPVRDGVDGGAVVDVALVPRPVAGVELAVRVRLLPVDGEPLAVDQLAVERGERGAVREAGQAAPVERDPAFALDRRPDHPRGSGADVERRGEVVEGDRGPGPRVDRARAVDVVDDGLRSALRGVDGEVDEKRSRLLGPERGVGRRARRQPPQPVAVAVRAVRLNEGGARVGGENRGGVGGVDDVDPIDGGRDRGGVGQLQVVDDVVLPVGTEEREGRLAERAHRDGGERVRNRDAGGGCVAGAVAGAVVPDGGAAVPDAGALGVPDPGEQAATTSPAAIRTAAALSLRGPTVWSRLMALTSSRRRGRA